MNLNRGLPLIFLILGTGACQTGESSRTTSVDDGLLLEVSAAERSNIAAARKSCDHAHDALAAAQAERARAGEARSVAGQVRDAAIAKVGRSEDVLARASRSGSSEDISTARQDVLNAKAEKDVQDAKVALCDTQTDHANSLAVLASQHVKVAEASVELTKAKALNTLDRPRSQTPEVSTFETGLRLAEADENVARSRAEAAQREVAIAATVVGARESAAEALRRM